MTEGVGIICWPRARQSAKSPQEARNWPILPNGKVTISPQVGGAFQTAPSLLNRCSTVLR